MCWTILSLFKGCLLDIWDDIIDTLWFLIALFSLSFESVILHPFQIYYVWTELSAFPSSFVTLKASCSVLPGSSLAGCHFECALSLNLYFFIWFFGKLLSDYSQICVSFKFIFKSNNIKSLLNFFLSIFTHSYPSRIWFS